MMSQTEILSRHQIMYVLHSSFLQVYSNCCAFCQPTQRVKFCWAKPAHFDFSSSSFTMQDLILSTAGDALRVCHISPWRCQLLPLLESQLSTGLGLTGYIFFRVIKNGTCFPSWWQHFYWVQNFMSQIYWCSEKEKSPIFQIRKKIFKSCHISIHGSTT
jgi:hypothetical protein